MSDSQNQVELPPAAQVEALLFVATEPVTIGQLATALGASPAEVDSALQDLDASLHTRGLRLQRFNGRLQLTTAPQAAEAIERFLGLEATSHLSRAALETLAIIAYQQPVTRPQVDAVRGVNSDGVMKSLLSKGLIQESGRAEGPGRPILYSTTTAFLQYFGLSSLTELPPLHLPEEQGVALLKE
ncbi:MAG: SMC-Scp complex subunit ScpB [Anaerolineales bacterium]